MLGENIKVLRKAKGLSQQELAERLHVVRQTVSKWEQGLSVPDARPAGAFGGLSGGIGRGAARHTPAGERRPQSAAGGAGR